MELENSAGVVVGVELKGVVSGVDALEIGGVTEDAGGFIGVVLEEI